MDDRITLLDLCESVLEGMKQPLDQKQSGEGDRDGAVQELDVPPKDAYRSLDLSLKNEIEKPEFGLLHYSGYGFGLKKFKIKILQLPAQTYTGEGPSPLLVRYISTNNRFNAVARSLDSSTSQQIPGLGGRWRPASGYCWNPFPLR